MAATRRACLAWSIPDRVVDLGPEVHARAIYAAIAALLYGGTEPLFGDPDQTASRLLASLEEYAVTEFVGATLEARGIDLRPSPSAQAPDHLPGLTSERVTELLTDSLFEHEPVLKAQIDRWREGWERFQSVRRDQASQAVCLGRQLGVEDESARRMGAAAAHEVMVRHLQGQPPEYPLVQKNDDCTRTLVFRPGTPGDNMIVGSEASITDSMATYDSVYEQLSLTVRMAPVDEAYRSLVETMGMVVDTVDRLMLKGRPNGRCSALCPTAFANAS